MDGKLEAGATPEECVIREVLDESGFVIQNLRLHGLLVFTNFKGNDWYVFVYTAAKFTGELSTLDKGSWNGFPMIHWLRAKLPNFSAGSLYNPN